MRGSFGRTGVARRPCRPAAFTAIAALIANIALPVIVALSFGVAGAASASPFPICSAHAALAGGPAPVVPGGDGPAGDPAATPRGCPLCPAPLPLSVPSAPVVIPVSWLQAAAPSPSAERIFPPAAGPSPVWPQAPPVAS